ncbi:BREX system Lon protease-like protein BrxL [Aurantimonas sp. A2-1-M11]
MIRGEMFTSGYGFIVDYLAEILRHLRSQDFALRVNQHFTVGKSISTRDRDAVYKTSSGLLKLLFPNGGESEAELEELLHLSMECRKRVKDQLFRIDSTYPDVDFHYVGADGQKRRVTTVEEEEFPQFYGGGPHAHLKRKRLRKQQEGTMPPSAQHRTQPKLLRSLRDWRKAMLSLRRTVKVSATRNSSVRTSTARHGSSSPILISGSSIRSGT